VLVSVRARNAATEVVADSCSIEALAVTEVLNFKELDGAITARPDCT
jgi:hypothetical protein